MRSVSLLEPELHGRLMDRTEHKRVPGHTYRKGQLPLPVFWDTCSREPAPCCMEAPAAPGEPSAAGPGCRCMSRNDSHEHCHCHAAARPWSPGAPAVVRPVARLCLTAAVGPGTSEHVVQRVPRKQCLGRWEGGPPARGPRAPRAFRTRHHGPWANAGVLSLVAARGSHLAKCVSHSLEPQFLTH